MVLLIQTVALGCALLLTFWLRPPPWVVLASMGLVAGIVLVGGLGRRPQSARAGQLGLLALCAGTFGVFGSAISWSGDFCYLDTNNEVIVALVSLFILVISDRLTNVPLKRACRMVLCVWLCSGVILLLTGAYLQNDRWAFYLGLVAGLGMFILCKAWFALGSIGIQAVNTLILLFAGLPLLDWLVAPRDHFDVPPKLEARPYSHEFAQKDPAAHKRWFEYIETQNETLFKTIFLFDSTGAHLRPNASVRYVGGQVSINSKGFRGAEIPDEKGNDYRIVALGESTTFGITMGTADKPWAEILEQLIQDRLKPNRRVQVINAGFPAITLEENLKRLSREILPLQPDMIISYHGYNGFRYIFGGLPPIRGGSPPRYQRRPLKLLADCEYGLKMRSYRKQYSVRGEPRLAFSKDPMDNKYARLYEQLIQVARTNSIRLVLGTYSMAVNEQSPPAVVEFYRSFNPPVKWAMQANVIHTQIVRQLAQAHQELTLVDTQPVLDGYSTNYYDLMHFAYEGEQKMAEVFFGGISAMLREDLSKTNVAQSSGRTVSD